MFVFLFYLVWIQRFIYKWHGACLEASSPKCFQTHSCDKCLPAGCTVAGAPYRGILFGGEAASAMCALQTQVIHKLRSLKPQWQPRALPPGQPWEP